MQCKQTNQQNEWQKYSICFSQEDIDGVLRSHKIFLNVSKRQMAKNTDLMTAFNTDNVNAICKEIMEKGELQVSEKERHSEMDSLFKDIATIISDKYLNPQTKCPYSVSTIEQAMKDINYSVKPYQTVEQQVLEVKSLLKDHIRLEKTNMRIKLVISGKDAKKMKEKIVPYCVTVEEEIWNGAILSLIGIIVPGSLITISDIITKDSKGTGKLDVLNLVNVVDVDSETLGETGVE